MPQKSTTYRTKQKDLVLSLIMQHKTEHLTIDDICSYLKEADTPVGKTTVYRQVQRLCDEGIVAKYSIDNDSPACYQYSGESCKNHFHLKCTKCQELFHATCSYIDSIESHIFSHHGFMVDNSKTVFYGVCQNCIRSEKKKSSEMLGV